MFIDATMATRIDRAEAQLAIAIAESVRASQPDLVQVCELAGGAAVFVRPGSPINKVVGVGFDGPLDPHTLAGVEAAWQIRGEPVRVELASLASVEAARQLGVRGYRLIGFEHVLVRRLHPGDAHAEPDSPDLLIRRDDHAAWLTTLVAGFAAADDSGQPVDAYTHHAVATVMQDLAGAPGFERHVAYRGGLVAGAATMRMHGGVALLCGAATLPAARRRGVQTALLASRLRDAALAGCEFASVTTPPGSQSQHNAARHGFVLSHARAIVVLEA